MSNNPEVIIVGAGIAGAALATTLSRDGRRVLCLERSLYNSNHAESSKEPELHEMSGFQGEYLQPAGVSALSALGLSSALEDIETFVSHGMIIFRGEKSVKLSYADIPNNNSTTGRFFHHGRFVRKLREVALAEPNLQLLHAVVTRTVRDDDGRVSGVAFHRMANGRKDEQEEVVSAPLTIICDGIGGFLPHVKGGDRPKKTPAVDAYALKLAYPSDPQSFVNIIAQDEASVIFYPLESATTRCIVLYPPGTQGTLLHLQQSVGQNLPEILQAPFKDALATARPMKQTSYTRSVPSRQPDPGLLVIGDSLKARNAFTGMGMTIALNDVLLVREMLLKFDALDSHNGGADRVVRVPDMNCKLRAERRARTTPVDFLANAMYHILGRGGLEGHTSKEELSALSDVRDGAFGYFASDPKIGAEMLALISGLRPDRSHLLLHLMMMAMFMFWFFASGVRGLSIRGVYRGFRAVATLLSLTTPTLLAERFVPSFRSC